MSIIPHSNATIFDHMYGRNWVIPHPHWDQPETDYFAPILKADIIESDTEFKVLVDLPGVYAKDIHVTIENSSLLLKAERKFVKETNGHHVHTLERSYGSVQRMFHLPKNADLDHAATLFKDGVLTVIVPKVVAPSPRRKLAINSD